MDNKVYRINENTTIEEIVRRHPKLIRPLKEYGITCVACGEPVWGTLAENAKNKNISELRRIIKEMNQIISEGTEKE
jgi:hypothetical protein